MHRILEENPKFNIDVTDQLGRTAMRLAIENEHLEVRLLSFLFFVCYQLFFIGCYTSFSTL